MKPRSLRSRMTATFAFAFAALILIFGSFVIWFSRHMAERNADTVMQAAAIKLEGDYVEAKLHQDSTGWSDEPNELIQQNLALVLVSAKGTATPKTPGITPSWPNSDRYEWRILTRPLGTDTAVIGFKWRKIENTLRFQAWMLTFLSLLFFITATFGVWILVGRTLTPIYGLSLQAETASTDNLRIQLCAPSQDTEMVHLVGTLNALLARLSGAISARERFYAAASHELRTPLQTLTGFLELALMRPRGAGEYREALDEAFSQSQRLSSLVQALLLLNQLEATPVRNKETLNLQEQTEHSISEFAPLAQSRHLRITFAPTDAVFVQAISTHLVILLRNLLENAVKYAEPESTIRICLHDNLREAVLTIYNSCPRLLEWDEVKLYEPFYRPDASRNSSTGGNGLGLAICKAIADANGWQLSIKQVDEGVLATVSFTYPVD